MGEFHDKFSFSVSPKKLKFLMRSIFVPNIVSHGDKSNGVFLHLREQTMYFFTFNESLFTANQVLTSASSELIIEISMSNLHH